MMTPRYQVLLLDADGTLFDFDQAEHQAFMLTAKEFELPMDEASYRLYSRINDGLWKKLERREVTKGELVVQRFAEFLQAVGMEGDPAAINGRYRVNLGEGYFLYPGAEELCRELSQYCRLIIATNGVTFTQNRRLELSPIAPYIEALVASESGGADKPDLRFFTYLDEMVGPLDKSQVLMVGDRLEADILGGQRFGVDTCWYNPENTPLVGEAVPTHMITELSQLRRIVLEPDKSLATV